MTKLLINGQHLFYSPTLAAKIGRSKATLLQQAFYWMQAPGGKIVEGIKWIWKTYKDWAKELQLSISTIRRAVAGLEELGLIKVEQLSAKTWYQANYYTVDIEAVKTLLFQNEHMDVVKENTCMCSERTNHIKDYSSENNSPQQQERGGGEKELEQEGEIEWDFLKNPTQEEQAILALDEEEPSQSTETRYVEEKGSVSASNESISSEDILPAPKKKISSEEMSAIARELRSLRIDPTRCDETIKRFWENVPGAIAYVKEALASWKKVESPIAVFTSACKKGLKSENSVVVGFGKWFDWARGQRLVQASRMIEGVHHVCLADESWVKAEEAIAQFPIGS